MKINEIEAIKMKLLGVLDDPEFVNDLFREYKGREGEISQIINESFEEIVEMSNPFRYEMVSPETFLDDPYYCGINPESGVGVCESIYPQLRKDFINIHSPDSVISEVVLTGSIGWGKSFFMQLGVLWQLYYLACLKYPQRYYRLAPSTPIGIIIISVTERQGKKNIFATVKDMIRMIPFFQENFMFDEKKATDSLIFPNKIELFPASSSHSSNIGLHLFSGAMDEANFFKKIKNSKRSENGTGLFDEAKTLYRSLRRRLDSRFLKRGRRPGILYLGSSRVYPNDFTTEHIDELESAMRKTGNKSAHIMDYNQWKVNRDAYSKQEFRVEIGELNRRSRILNEFEKPKGKVVINVPMDFYDAFERDIENAIRDIAGLGVHAIQPFIGNKDKIMEMFDEGLQSIFSVEQATLSPKSEFLVREFIRKTCTNPDVPRYSGMDIGITKDRFGFAVGYIEGYADMKRELFNDETQKMESYTERLPKIVVELLLEIVPEKEFGEVEIARVRYLIFQLIKKLYRVRRASCDGFQSKDMQQQMKRNGINMVYVSMDRTPEPYETFRTALYEGRIRSVYHPKLEIELNELERDYSRNKIDHPPTGCFLGETKIKLLNGKHVKIKELVGKSNVELYGCKSDGEIIPTIAKKIWKTKEVVDYLQITLDNGEIVKCTPEHKFMLRDGTYKEAQYLSNVDSLMPLYSNYEGSFLNGYERFQNNKTKKQVFTHSMVDRYYNGKRDSDDVVVHHYDINPKNNSSINLKRMTREDHARVHSLLNELGNKPENIARRVKTLKRNTRIRAGIDPDSKLAPWEIRLKDSKMNPAQVSKHLTKISRTSNRRKLSRAQANKVNSGYWQSEEGKLRRQELSKTQLKEALAKRIQREDDRWLSKFDTSLEYKGIAEIYKIYGGGNVAVKRRLKSIGYIINIGYKHNHKIVKIEKIHSKTPIPVYDIEVPVSNNFALSAGIFVHNSKDMADAVASMVYNMHVDPVYSTSDLMPSIMGTEGEDGATQHHEFSDDPEIEAFEREIRGM